MIACIFLSLAFSRYCLLVISSSSTVQWWVCHADGRWWLKVVHTKQAAHTNNSQMPASIYLAPCFKSVNLLLFCFQSTCLSPKSLINTNLFQSAPITHTSQSCLLLKKSQFVTPLSLPSLLISLPLLQQLLSTWSHLKWNKWSREKIYSDNLAKGTAELGLC